MVLLGTCLGHDIIAFDSTLKVNINPIIPNKHNACDMYMFMSITNILKYAFALHPGICPPDACLWHAYYTGKLPLISLMAWVRCPSIRVVSLVPLAISACGWDNVL